SLTLRAQTDESLRRAHATEPDVGRARVHAALAAAAGHVARAELVAAQERTAALHALHHAGLLGIETISRSLRVAPGAAAVGVVAVPVSAPLPDVAGHVVEAKIVGRVAGDRRRPFPAVLLGVLGGEAPLPGVGHPLPAGAEFVPPDVGRLGLLAARGVL